MYYWHGVQVPADLIEGAGWTAERILLERNEEFRRCAVERIDCAMNAKPNTPSPRGLSR